ncbi:MAG: helix-turn-helix domain-containing protein [Oscillospiraceae bacterium]|nr:helix-turn-helix domain-containing protein [Oscillospiraceae bacterium]
MDKTKDVCVLRKEDFFRPNENMHIQKSDDFPDYIGIPHKHEYIEVVYVVSGRAVHEIDGKKYNVKRGDLFIVNMNTTHVFYSEKSETDPFVAYDLMFTPEFFDSSMSGYHSLEVLNNSFMFHSLFSERKELPPYFSVSGSEYTMFGELFNKIYLEHKGCQKGYREIIRAYLVQLIITIFRLDEDKIKNVGNMRNKQIVSFIIDYINENYDTQLSVNKMAQMVYLNPDYLGRIFKSMTGMSISLMIQKVRVAEVCKLLTTTKKSVSEIAVACGFDDMKFFYTVFKKHMGVLPGYYRKNTREDK